MGKPTDARSDLYAMGVMFFEMLTGHKVFEGRDTFAVSYAHVYEPVPPLPPEHARFQGIVNKLLAKDPKDRYQSAGEMVAALKKHRAGAPATAEPATRRVDTSVSSPLQQKLKQMAASEAEAGATTVNSPTGPVNLHAETAVSKPIEAVPPKAEVAAKKPAPVMLIAAVLVLVGVIAVGVTMWPKPTTGNSDADIPEAILSTEQRLEVSRALSAAESFITYENYEAAILNYVKVLEQFDCNNREARRGLQPLDEAKYKEIVAKCAKP